MALVVANVHRYELMGEATFGGRACGPSVALYGKLIQIFASYAPLVRDHLGTDALFDQSTDRRIALRDARKGQPASLPIEAPIATRDMDSTPAATTTS